MNLLEASLGAIDGILAREQAEAVATLHEGIGHHRRTAWILSYTGVSNEPRVIRQAWSLSRAGWNVVVAGFEGHSPRPPEWNYVQLHDTPRSRSLPFRGAMRLQRLAGKALYISAARVPPLASFGARTFYFGLPNWRQNFREILRLAASAPRLAGDLVIAHDFHTCPPAAALAEAWGVPLMVDCHEYGRGQYMDNPEWVRDGRLFATAMQDDYLARAAAVTTVSDGIAERLTAEQRLRRPAVTIRSLPFRQPQPFRPTGERIGVVYHGILSVDRGLAELVRSVAMWRPYLWLTVRGSGEALAMLREIARESGVAERVNFEPPVPLSEIIPAAARADIGYFVQPDYSPQKRFTLPNKFFEYVMAGLALCVSDLPEMRRIVERHRLGRLISGVEPAVIAETLNGLTPPEIDGFKLASIDAAAELNWEVEQQRFLDLVELVWRECSMRR